PSMRTRNKRSATPRWRLPRPSCSRWRSTRSRRSLAEDYAMTGIVDRYFATLAERLDKVRTTQAAAIEQAAALCAKSIAAGKLVFTFGTGHGALPALECFPRTGTIVGFRPIV